MCSLKTVIYGIVWIILLSPLIIISLIVASKKCYWYKAVIFDVGSTGTRGIQYVTQQSLYPEWTAVERIKCETGAGPGNGFSEKLQSMDHVAIKEHYRNCFKNFSSTNGLTGRVRFFFKATAGMRNYCLTHMVKCKEGFQLIRDVASEMGFIFSANDVGLLTGLEEGAYQYVYVNQHPPESVKVAKHIGTLDLGGESLEIVVPQLTNLVDASIFFDRRYFEYMDKFYLLEVNYSDCHGEKPAKSMMQVKMLRQSTQADRVSSEIIHPCLPTDTLIDFETISVSPFCKVPTLVGATDEVKFRGQFNFDQCINKINEFLLDGCETCLSSRINKIYINSEIQFLGVGSFPKSLKDFGLTGIVKYDQFESSTASFCAEESNDDHIKRKQHRFCWMMMYQNALVKWFKIEQQFHISDNDKMNSWANGFIENSLYRSSNCWVYFYTFSGFAAIFVIFNLAVTISYYRRKKAARWQILKV